MALLRRPLSFQSSFKTGQRFGTDHCPNIALNPRLVNCQRFPGRILFSWLVTSSCGWSRPIYIPMKSCAVSYGKATVSKVSSKFRIFWFRVASTRKALDLKGQSVERRESSFTFIRRGLREKLLRIVSRGDLRKAVKSVWECEWSAKPDGVGPNLVATRRPYYVNTTGTYTIVRYLTHSTCHTETLAQLVIGVN